MMHFQELLAKLSAGTSDLDKFQYWPGDQISWLSEAGVLRWGLPEEFGGTAISESSHLEGYIDLASACLSTTFVLTQRNGACQRIACSENPGLKQMLLPDLISGKTFATVGISHLTTSRQHLSRPAVRVTQIPGGFNLEGSIPWVTGAAQADFIVAGGSLDDGRQILIAVPGRTAGVQIDPHAGLMSLTSSHTASITLSNVFVSEEFLIAGPMNGVMNFAGKSGTGSLVTSALAIGLSTRAVNWIQKESVPRNDLQSTAAAFEQELRDLLKVTMDVAAGSGSEQPDLKSLTTDIRQRANSLALRSTQAMLAVSKGAGFVQGHPAEQAVREAMFFLVWSCPQPVVAAALRELSCSDGLPPYAFS